MTDYQKFLRNNNLAKNGLLGEYNQNDEYVISRDIIDELIKINKLVVSYKEEGIKCEALLQDLKLNFIIKSYFDDKNINKYSSLYLIEEYKNHNQNVVLQTFLVNFHDVDNNLYFDKLKKVFNLYTKDESEGKDIKNSNSELIKIISKKKALAKSINNEIAIEDRKYIIDVIKILKQSGDYGLFIQKLLKEELGKIKHNKNTAAYWIELKAKLDEILFEHYDKCPQETKKWLDLVNQNYVLIYMNKEKKLKNPTKVEKASANKKKSAKAKGKDGGGDDKKADKAKKKPSKAKSSSSSSSSSNKVSEKVETKVHTKNKSKVFEDTNTSELKFNVGYSNILNNFEKISINQLGGGFSSFKSKSFSDYDFDVTIEPASKEVNTNYNITNKHKEDDKEITL